MERVTKIAACLALLLVVTTGSLQAQEHVTSDDALRSALTEGADAETADRAVLDRLLERDEVREVAGEAGLDVERARGAVDQLEGKELARLASMARDAEDQLAGGDTTITITATTIVIALLVAILIAVL